MCAWGRNPITSAAANQIDISQVLIGKAFPSEGCQLCAHRYASARASSLALAPDQMALKASSALSTLWIRPMPAPHHSGTTSKLPSCVALAISSLAVFCCSSCTSLATNWNKLARSHVCPHACAGLLSVDHIALTQAHVMTSAALSLTERAPLQCAPL